MKFNILTMGISVSKNKDKTKTKNKNKVKERATSVLNMPPPTIPAKIEESNDEDPALTRLRHQLNEDLETFLLNNLLLSVQFFENYEREIGALRINPTSKKEADINTKLTDHQKHSLLPDKLHDLVSSRVRFRREHGVRKYRSEALHPQRMYVVFDNIEMYYEGDVMDYGTVLEGPFYRGIIERADRDGYVKLRIKEILGHNKQTPKEQLSMPNESDPDDVFESSIGTPDVVLRHPNFQSTSSSILGQSSIAADHDNEVVPSIGQQALEEIREQIEQPPPPTFKYFPNSNLAEINNNVQKRNIFGPNTPEKEIVRRPSFTPTERRLSGIRRNDNLKKSSQVVSRLLPQRTPNKILNSYRAMPTINNADADSDYGYATITNHSTVKPLDQMRTGHQTINSTTAMSDECITFKVCKVINFDDDDDDEIDERFTNPRDPRRIKRKKNPVLFETRQYLNSNVFSADFGDLFAARLAGTLGFSSEVVQASMMQGNVIYSDTTEGDKLINYEVMPAVTTAWPEIASLWVIRRRPEIIDRRNNISYRWPAQWMINKVRNLGCHILPIGYMPKRGENVEMPLEWRLAFPAAERYLETCLTHAQIRCYLFALALYKSFMEQTETKLGLTVEHIRTFLFWECERNFVTWPEDRMGEKTIFFLRRLYERLSAAVLPDYFVPERNLFESTPRANLMAVQRKIFEIIENPVMYILIALRNLRYVDKFFYPSLDYKRLYSIIITDNVFDFINPALATVIRNEEIESDSDDDIIVDETVSFWEHVKNRDPNVKWQKRAHQHIRHERAALENQYRRDSVDSISTNIKIRRVADSLRKVLILKMFIPHFIQMAKRSNEYDATGQSLIYLRQADFLCTLLDEEPASEGDSHIYAAQIRKLEETIDTSSVDATPLIPQRNQRNDQTNNAFNMKRTNRTKPTTPSTSQKSSDSTTSYVNMEQISAELKSYSGSNGNNSNPSPIVVKSSVIVEQSPDILEQSSGIVKQSSDISEQKHTFVETKTICADVHRVNLKSGSQPVKKGVSFRISIDSNDDNSTDL